ncbi:hypothetical protein DL768_011223 [Monosporascus sp. mg162]|nr:hypothetical protein DL768_011223 [Monosporascus sp. mg162]
MAKIRWIERQPVIHHVKVTAKNDADDVVTSAAFAVAEKPEEPEKYKKPEATVPEDENDLKDKVILESEDEDFVAEPVIEEFLPPKLTGPRAFEKVVHVVTGAKIQLPSKIDCQDCAVAKARKKVSRRP